MIDPIITAFKLFGHLMNFQFKFTKVFAQSVLLVAGAAAIGHALTHWQSADPAGLLAYLALALVASAAKLRIPGLTGTVSLGFVSVLDGIALMSLAEAV